MIHRAGPFGSIFKSDSTLGESNLPYADSGLEYTQATARIRKQVERISELVSEILYFTQGNQSSVVLAPMSYADFIHPLVEELRSECGAYRTGQAMARATK